MRFAVALACVMLICGSGCSRFAGEWLEEGRFARNGEFIPTEGPRRMALRFEEIATIRTGAYIDGPKVVDAETATTATYFTMQHGRVAQFGPTIAKVKGNRLTTWIGAEESRRFVRIKGPSVFPPRVVLPSLDTGIGGG